MVEILLELMLKVALLVGLGFFVKRRGIISEEMERGLSNLLINVIFPISVVASANNEFSMEKMNNIIVILVIALIYYIGAILLSTQIAKWLRFEKKDQSIYMTMATFGNTAFVGIPIVMELFGSEGVLYAVIFNTVYDLYFFTYGIAVLSGEGKFSLREAWNPCTQSALIAMVLFVLQLRIPAPVQESMETVGNMVVPLSMMIIGFSLSDIRFREVVTDVRSYYVSAVRLLLLPALVFAGCRLCGVSRTMTMLGTVMAALPCGSMNVIMAKQYDCDLSFATKSVVQSMIFGVVTIPLLVALGNLILG